MLALPVGLAANVLKVGHHGSNTASGQLFLDAVMPQAAIVSVGAKTPYHLPGAATLQRLTAATTLYRTDTDGTVAVTLGYGRTAAGKVGGSVADGMYDRMDGIGSHDVVIETPRHDRQLEDMSVPEIADIFRTFILRVNELKKDPRIKYVMIFKNFGRNAGASLAHPHSQIVAMPMTPIRVAQEIAGAKKYREDRGVCVFCDILRQETRYKKRVVGETGNFLAVTPYASRFTFETWIIPKKHQSHFERMAPGLAADLAGIVKNTVGKLRASVEELSYNLIVHTMPLRDRAAGHYHWHIEIMPKLSRAAGFEWGTGFYINTVSPEDAAEMMNKGKKYKV